MIAGKTEIAIPDEVIMSKIYIIRGNKVMLDKDLAGLYEVELKRLNEQVKRNLGRFPKDFMFQLNNEEFKNLKSQIATSSWGGRRKIPFAFTEHGVLMLSGILNSERAIKINIQIIRIFVKMREMLMENKHIRQHLERIQDELTDHDEKIILIFEYINQLEQYKQLVADHQIRQKIGFRQHDD
jgi:phage regulator Rha-like protein